MIKFFDILEENINYSLKKVIKGVWRMPWHLKAMKDVISCDKLGGEANTHYIPRFPNGTTHYTEGIVSLVKREANPLN